jgi:ATP-binding cassette subfamily B protein
MFQILRNLDDLPDLIFRHDDLITKIHPTLEILKDTSESVKDPQNPLPFNPKQGAISIKNLNFAYQENKSNTTVFKDFNLEIAGGEKVGIVGLSGAGKSTLASLLMRFDDIQSGEILIDGINIRDVKQSKLREKISYVPQEPLLFHRSVRDNIAYHDNKSTDKEVVKATKAAHAHDFIKLLPDKYSTIVGERGVKLSGGQKQRVVIARAVLKKAPIIIFDEATSALDSESENIIQKSLPEILGNHTSVVIAHRLSTVAGLDRIIVIQDGKIIEQGTHNQLLKNNGQYRALWNRQTSDEIS